MNDDERLDDMIRKAARDWTPPPAPREAMWAEIDRRRKGRRGARSRGRILPFPGGRAATGGWIALAAAAVLAVGFGLGRISRPDPGPVAEVRPEAGAVDTRVSPGAERPADAAPGQPAGGTAAPRRSDVAYRAATADFLGRTETMLAQFAGPRPVNGDDTIHDWARELLQENRLLIDNNPTADPELTRLLGDLETVLTQIVMRTGSDDDSDWIRESMEERSILLRVRSKIPAAVPFPGT